jgi:hypothetical protein
MKNKGRTDLEDRTEFLGTFEFRVFSEQRKPISKQNRQKKKKEEGRKRMTRRRGG